MWIIVKKSCWKQSRGLHSCKKIYGCPFKLLPNPSKYPVVLWWCPVFFWGSACSSHYFKICPTGGFNRTFQFLPWKSVVPFLCFSCVVLKVILWDANGVPKQKHNKMCIDCFFFSVGSNCAGGSGDPVETMAFIRPLIWMLLFGLGLGKD